MQRLVSLFRTVMSSSGNLLNANSDCDMMMNKELPVE